MFEEEKAFSRIVEEEKKKREEEEKKKREEAKRKRDEKLTVVLGSEKVDDECVMRRPAKVYCKKCNKIVLSRVKKEKCGL